METHQSISHFTGREQQALLRVKNHLVFHYDPLIIYCLGIRYSHHRIRSCYTVPRSTEKWTCSCELLVILPADTTLGKGIEQELKCLFDDIDNVRIVAHTFDFMAQQLQEKSLFFCWAQRSAIMLFERGASSKKLPARIPKHPNYVQQADRFYREYPNFKNYKTLRFVSLPPLYKLDMETAVEAVPLGLLTKNSQLFEQENGLSELQEVNDFIFRGNSPNRK